MKQLSFPIGSESSFEAALSALTANPAYASASDVLGIVILGKQSPDYAKSLIAAHAGRGIKGHLLGYTMNNCLVDGINTEGGSTVTFFIFESAKADVYCYETEEEAEASCGDDLTARLAATENARAVQLFLDVYHIRRLDDFLGHIHLPHMTFPLIGACAGGTYKGGLQQPMFVFADRVYTRGIAAVIYSGADLEVKTKVLMSWMPLGRQHTFTKLLSPTVVSEIDDLPATFIFKKYFNIEPNEAFEANSLGFPLYVKRNGEEVPRSILTLDGDQNLIFASDIREGETFYFSYGSISRILKDDYDYSKKLSKFAPQALFLMICDYRITYLEASVQKEIDLFSTVAPSLAGGGAFGELFNINGKPETMNCTMVVLALREGAPDPKEVVVPEEPSFVANGAVPLVDRLYSFLSETSNEYASLRNKERERSLRNAVEVEKAANEAKSLFLSNISHEIRTPINAILGMNEMILREATDEHILDYADDIRSAGNSLLSLVNDVLDFSKIESGKLEIIPVEYSLSSMINDLATMISPLAEKKGLTLNIEYDSEAPDRLYGDIVRIRQVLVNILNNAVKFTEKGSVTFTMAYEKTKRDEVNLEFHVIDTGRGIKPEDMDKVFTPFERADEAQIRNIEGTGLGMSISTRLLKIMGSSLSVSSEYGKGSDFSFKIRQKVFSFEPIGDYFKRATQKNAARRTTAEAFHAPEARILVVDDMDMNLSVVRNLLKRTEIQIDTALSGQQSIELASKNPYDIIFMDHRMPVMDGIEAMQHIRALPAGNPNEKTPIIALTASAVAGSRDRFLTLGFDDYIPKPIEPDVLEKKIKDYLPSEKIILTSAAADTDDDESRQLSPFLQALLSEDQIDVFAGIAACGGAETYEKVLTEFVKNAEANREIIVRDLQEENYSDYTIRVHSLKSSARLAGAASLSRHAAYLEQCGDAMRTEEIVKKTPALIREYGSVIKAVSDALPREDDSKKELLMPDMLQEAYQAIYESVAAFDFDGADNVMSELKKYRVADQEKSFFDRVENFLTRVDHDGLVELLGPLFDKK